MSQPILELRQITKTFGAKVANDAISLAVAEGTVHAIVGENGAGKSTLMNIISGNLQPDSGEILLDGEPITLSDPGKADDLGIGMVHQHFKLVPSLTVAANVFLGREMTTRFGSLDQAAMESRVEQLSARFGLPVDPRAVIRDLSVGVRQRVEIIKALSHDTRVLILDEPTAVLTPAETIEFFIVMRQLAGQGCAVLFISHKLGEVLSVADEVSVLRDGAVIDTRPAQGLEQHEIASMMVGRDVLLRVKHTPSRPTGRVLSVENLYAVDPRGTLTVENLSLEVRRGEIVGIAGVEGNGQSELAAVIAGMLPPSSGRIGLAGDDITTLSVADRRKLGLGYIPEDRNEEGAAPSLSVAENITATDREPPIARHGWLSLAAMAQSARTLISRFDIRGADADTTLSTLSGGNVQKVVIAREFSSHPTLLVVAQPTRGVDVGAMEFVHNSLISARDNGAGVLLISADLTEIMTLSDRLLVLFRGRIIAEFRQGEVSESAVGLAMAGVAPTPEALRQAEISTARMAHELEASGAALVEDTTVLVDESPLPSPSPPSARPSPSAARSDPMTAGRRVDSVLTALATHAFSNVRQPALAVGIALLVGAIVIAILGSNPLVAYIELFGSAWRTPFGIASIIAMFIPLAIMATGTIISFRAGFFNVGGEGQLYFGAFFGAYAGFTFQGLPSGLHIVLVLLFGAAAGAIWGLIPGVLYGYLRVSIVVVTLLLSEVAKLITNYLVTGPFQDPTAGIPGSPRVDPDARILAFNPAYGIGPDLFIAIAVAVGLGFVLNRSTWGFRVKQLGELNRFAEYTGVSTRAMSVQVLAVSGAVAGFAGALYVLGPNGGRFLQVFSPGFGFLAITVALLARLNPWAALVAALFYSTMIAGGTGLQAVGVPYPMVNVLQGLIIIAITATAILNWRRRRSRGGSVSTSTAVLR